MASKIHASMLAPLLMLAVAQQRTLTPVNVEYVPFAGLQVSVGDVKLIEGSGFQFYERGWTKGYYSSAWKPVEIYRDRTGTINVISNSDDGLVTARQSYTPSEAGFRATAEFQWRGEKPAMLEFAVGRFWAPYFADGRVIIDGFPPREVGGIGPPAGTPVADRMVAFAQNMAFLAPSASVLVESAMPLGLMDARNHTIDWARGKELLWIGVTDYEIRPQGTARFQYTVRIQPEDSPGKTSTQVSLPTQELPKALTPGFGALPLFPKPKEIERRNGSLDVSGGIELELPDSLMSEAAWLGEFLKDSWVMPTDGGDPLKVVVDIAPGITRTNGYTLEASSLGVWIRGESEEGARYGIRTLAQLVYPEGGRLKIPHVKIEDWPSTQWRGVHLFVGPKALNFQSKLFDRALSLAKLNKVVLQCERTRWDAIPGIETAITMSKNDLVALAQKYRSHGVEVVPLVQSMGHMEWFFANKKNLDIAVNPAVPYTLDVRRALARETIAKLWAEVAETLQPSTVHFGLDEIDNRGIDDKRLTERLFTAGLPVLNGIAEERQLTPMVWSDMFLASGEAIDATHAPDRQIARQRRQMLKKGTYVADWHYRDDSRIEPFETSLRLWRSEGMRPIAATWYRPNNVRSFTLAAVRNGAGVLQTTWAGYESSEANMIREFDQFAAILMMADYAWSGRTEAPDKLGYVPQSLLRRLYFGGRQALEPVKGIGLGNRGSQSFHVGSHWFLELKPIQFYGVTNRVAYASPHEVEIPLDRQASELVLALDCLATVPDNSPVLEVDVHFKDRPDETFELRYGSHLRAANDPRPAAAFDREGTRSAVNLEFEPGRVKALTIRVAGSAAGPRVHGITLL